MYLDYFNFPDSDEEFDFLLEIKRTCYDSKYPFKVLSKNRLERLEFEPVTILYGGNGSGKSTALNVIAEKYKLERDSIFNKSNFYQDYVDMCSGSSDIKIPIKSRIITSDDVFECILNIRTINERIDDRREEVFDEYLNLKHSVMKVKSIDDYDELKKITKARRLTQSKFVRESMADNIKGHSNGESAYMYFTEKIKEDSLYLLDEPENSLSPKRQLDLMKFIEDSSRFFNCQFIISTHSPFLLSIRNAKIYNLDKENCPIQKWTQLENVRIYYDFFTKYKNEF